MRASGFKRLSCCRLPLGRHWLKTIINTTPSTHPNQHNIINNTINTSSSTQHHQHNIINTPSTQHHLHNTINTPSTQHHQHNIMNTITINTTSLTQHHQHRCSTWRTSVFGGPQFHCAWQVQHSQHLNVILCRRCSTRSTSISFCVAIALLRARPERSAEARRRLSTMDAGCFCVAGAALGGPQSHFAWQVQHSEHLQRGPRKSGDD